MREEYEFVSIENIHYNVIGFNQITVLACCKNIDGKLYKLTFNDLSVLKWFYDIYHKKNEYIHINPKDGKEYRQIDYNLALRAFPFLGLSKPSIVKIFEKLRKLKILDHFHDLREGSFSCYRINNDMYYVLKQPEEKSESKDEIVNNKLQILYKILETPLYFFIEDSKLFYRANILLENTIGEYPIVYFINKIKRDKNLSISNNLNKHPIEKEENKLPINNKENKGFEKNILLEKEYPEILEMFRRYGINIRTKSNTKVCQNLYKYLKQLEAGVFFKNKKFKDKWYNKYSISKAEKKILKKINYRKIKYYIKQSLIKFNDMRTQEHLLTIKGTDSISADNFIYNSFSQNSYFLQYMVNNPIANREFKKEIQLTKIEKKLQDIKISKSFLMENLYNNHEDAFKFNKEDWQRVFYTTWDLYNWFLDNEDNLKLFDYKINFTGFLKCVGRWLRTLSTMYPVYLDVNSKTWLWFNEWTKTNYDRDYRFTKERIKRKKGTQKKISDGVGVVDQLKVQELITDYIDSFMAENKDIPTYAMMEEMAYNELNGAVV